MYKDNELTALMRLSAADGDREKVLLAFLQALAEKLDYHLTVLRALDARLTKLEKGEVNG